LDFLPGNERVGWVDNDLIVQLESGDDLYLTAEVVPRAHGREHDLSVLYNADT
jgi:hypothetical protein